MAKTFDTGELVAALDDAEFPADDRPKTINDLPKELLVSVFIAVEDLRWVRHTVPCVCKEWVEIYRSQDASPLHETLEVDFRKELESALRERVARRGLGPRRPVVHASRVVSWTERRADWVRTLHLDGKYSGALEDFSSEDLGRLVAVVGSSLTELRIGPHFEKYETSFFELCQKPFWESVRASIVPAGQLRSFIVRGASDPSESDVEPLGKLAGSLEVLALCTYRREGFGPGMTRFPESFCDLTELRHLALVGYEGITAIPAKISSLKKLEVITLCYCNLSSLPKELGELSGLQILNLAGNMNLRNVPQDEAFPANLGKMTSLRYLELSACGLRAVPAFFGELESLEVLELSFNDEQIYATLDILIEGCPRLREVYLCKRPDAAPWTPQSRAHLEAFTAKLLAKNRDAKVLY